MAPFYGPKRTKGDEPERAGNGRSVSFLPHHSTRPRLAFQASRRLAHGKPCQVECPERAPQARVEGRSSLHRFIPSRVRSNALSERRRRASKGAHRFMLHGKPCQVECPERAPQARVEGRSLLHRFIPSRVRSNALSERRRRESKGRLVGIRRRRRDPLQT